MCIIYGITIIIYSMLIVILYTLLYIEKKQSKKKGRKRENQGEGCRRHLRPFLASLLFRLMSSPSNHRQPLTTRPLVSALRERDGRPPRPLLGDVIATPRHHIATPRRRSTSSRAAPRRSAILPASSSSSSLLQVVRVGQTNSQGGPPLPAHPVDPLHPAGVPSA